MFIDYDFLHTIKDNPEWLKKFVEVYNKFEEAKSDYYEIVQSFFDDHAKEADYDAEVFRQIHNNLVKVVKSYEDFKMEVKSHIFVPSQE